MFYVTCPECGSRIEIDPSAIGPDRTDLWNLAYCCDCDATFDYDDDEVTEGAEPQAQ